MEKKIVFMLDIQNTIDGLDQTTKRKLIKILKLYKEKFNVDKIELFFSTFTVSEILEYVVNNFAIDLMPEISISKNFYSDGIYNYQNKSINFIERDYNYNKITTLREHYLDENVRFIGIIDDNLPEYQLTELKGKTVATLFSPTSKVLKTPMHYGTSVVGIKGVLELLENYIQNIQSLSYEEILEEQKNNKLVVDDNILCKDLSLKYDRFTKAFINDAVNSYEKALKLASQMYNLLSNCELSSEAVNSIKEYSKIIVYYLEEAKHDEKNPIVYKLKNIEN